VAFEIYKSGQGRYLRVGTFIGAVLVNLVVSWYLWLKLDQYLPGSKVAEGQTPSSLAPLKIYMEYGIPFVVFAVLAYLTWHFLNKPVAVDFLVATESEMKKVSWSSRAELFGSTMVVIATVFLMALVIWVVDTVFVYVLSNGLGLW
jgi:preprotein translocase SecE subunit